MYGLIISLLSIINFRVLINQVIRSSRVLLVLYLLDTLCVLLLSTNDITTDSSGT